MKLNSPGFYFNTTRAFVVVARKGRLCDRSIPILIALSTVALTACLARGDKTPRELLNKPKPDVHCRIIANVLDAQNRASVSRAEVTRWGTNVILKYYSGRQDNADVFIQNIDYSAWVECKSASKQYLLKEFHNDPNHHFAPRLQRSIDDEAARSLSTTSNFGGVLDDYHDDEIQFTRQPLTGASDRILRYDFKCLARQSQDKAVINLEGGNISIDTSRENCVIDGSFSEKQGAMRALTEFVNELEWSERLSWYCKKRTVSKFLISPDAKKKLRSGTSEFDYDFHYSPHREMFYLQHYNLPEPAGLTPPGSGYRTSILAVTAIFAVLALGSAYLRRRSLRPKAA